MNAAQPLTVTLPTQRSCPFDPPSRYQSLQQEQPIAPLAFPDGSVGWLLTRHKDVRAVLADDRFSSDRTRASSPVRRTLFRPQDSPGMLLNMDPPQHTHYRRMLTRHFTVRRMRALTPRIEQIVADHLDAIQAAGPPVDLVPTFARPIPSLVICELLGVPYADRDGFQQRTATLLKLDTPEDESRQARTALRQYMRDLVAAKRQHPDDALLSTLIQAGQDPQTALTDEELAGIGLLLLVAGHETTANMLALGTYTLLRHPDQLHALREHPENIERAVEELLRYLTILQFGPVRVARQDVELGGERIRAGQTVVLALAAANRDPHQFAHPDELDLAREPSQHVSFGHGVHQCLGQQLARVEMHVAFPALLRRFRGLRLAVAPEQVPMRDDMFIYGVHALPLTWDS
ncbi:cytochrome P450 [Nonomuraea sediminis]|uniref:cytochrome P450 n=1 Tax=Nonomuraea sediminis TaxID=2835864 RepID=UPI001BDCF52C|nr:cytochrome P450 [Nonomuraea sediminis]